MPQVNVYLDEKTFTELKLIAELLNKQLTELVREAIVEYIERKKIELKQTLRKIGKNQDL